MWNRYGSEMVNVIGFQEKTLRHMAMCFNRTKKLGDEVTKAGFIYLSEIYLTMFKDADRLNGEYKQMDKCVREKLYKSYKLLSTLWRFLV